METIWTRYLYHRNHKIIVRVQKSNGKGLIMFTGIVEETGNITEMQKQTKSARITVSCSKVREGTKLGDSIAVNGICLTVTKLHSDGFCADVMAETIRRSNLGNLKLPAKVNLERAMAANGRFGGHIVSGHIDGTGEITKISTEENAVWYTIATNSNLLRYMVEKGSITVDGISLTIAQVTEEEFKVSVIPHTRQETSLKEAHIHTKVNLECDILGKYVEKLLLSQEAKENEEKNKSHITMEFLSTHGFS